MSKRTSGSSAATRPRVDATVSARAAVLAFLKERNGAGVAEVAEHLGVSYEGARLQVARLEKEGLIEKRLVRGRAPGRPLARYVLSRAGEHAFPKSYDQLTIGLIDALTARLGPRALKEVLAEFTDRRVREWEPRLAGMPLKERIAALREIYGGDDPYMTVELARGNLRLIERNCPFLNVASARPVLCSVTVSTLERLLGVKVVREERFQTGHGRCVFRVLADQPIDVRRFRFAFEPEAAPAPAD